MSEMAEAIRELTQDKGFSMDSVKQTIENTLRAAYKRTFGTADNCIVTFADDMSDVTVASRKTIVDGVYDPVTEIELEDALNVKTKFFSIFAHDLKNPFNGILGMTNLIAEYYENYSSAEIKKYLKSMRLIK